MIKVHKTTTAPASLTAKKRYDGEDVKKQLANDQHDKCYICERKQTTDLQIEHWHSQQNYPNEKYDWQNLYFACGYCNRKKSAYFDTIINPAEEAVEEKIVQAINYNDKKAKADFSSADNTKAIQETIRLLNDIFNGKGKIRNFREERFFEEFISKMNIFQVAVSKYLSNKNEETKQVVRELLSVKEEFLGFKYWIIRNNKVLLAEFSGDIVWNKGIKR